MVSVIIPCYNQAHYLQDAVSSVLAQTYTNWECIIVNDGSTDATDQVATKLKSGDARIKYIKKENGGLSSARNTGLNEARGDYIQFIDSDDIIHPGKFFASLRQGENADIIISAFKVFIKSEEDAIAPPFTLTADNFTFDSILTGWDNDFVFPPHCGLFRSSLFKELRFNEDLTAREDWLMWLQIFRQDVTRVFINEPFALYRSSPNSMSQDKALMDANLIQVYQLVYKMLPCSQRDVFFEKVMKNMSRLLNDYSHLLKITRESKSYRIGNFFIRNFNKLT
ncbi:MAG TPA: glycosyltransferase family 2 protein [Chitinophagaceae bacterium]|nr:glycosyltransferase family 2 protein [Chitinophagaceae bacterium]